MGAEFASTLGLVAQEVDVFSTTEGDKPKVVVHILPYDKNNPMKRIATFTQAKRDSIKAALDASLANGALGGSGWAIEDGGFGLMGALTQAPPTPADDDDIAGMAPSGWFVICVVLGIGAGAFCALLPRLLVKLAEANNPRGVATHNSLFRDRERWTSAWDRRLSTAFGRPPPPGGLPTSAPPPQPGMGAYAPAEEPYGGPVYYDDGYDDGYGTGAPPPPPLPGPGAAVPAAGYGDEYTYANPAYAGYYAAAPTPTVSPAPPPGPSYY